MPHDLTRLQPLGDVSRRDFVMTALAAGFALAVQPVSAQTITTDTNGLEAGEVKIPVADGTIPAYRAMPAQGGPFPTVLVIQEIFGVHEHIKDICRRFAKLGYFAVAPELYARQGDVSKMTDFSEIIGKVVSKVPDKQVMSDLDAAVAWAKTTDKADTSKLGATGFCWGGRIVWLYAAHNPSLKAGVAWYGRLVGQADEGTGPGALRRGRHGNSQRHGGEHAEGAEGGRQAVRNRALPRHAPWVPRRLPSQLPEGTGGRRLEATAGVVQEEWGVTRQDSWPAKPGAGPEWPSW
jgi:dienelactone hydrolase